MIAAQIDGLLDTIVQSPPLTDDTLVIIINELE